MCACSIHVRCIIIMGRPSTIQLMHIRGPTIQTYEGPQGPGTMLLKSGTVPEIRGPLRPMGSYIKSIIIIMRGTIYSL